MKATSCGKAERLFRESLERDPTRTEARIRLGRVLGRRGRHQDAIVELRRATMGTKNRLLLYYGHMFLGAEADAARSDGRSATGVRARERAVSARTVTAPGASVRWQPARVIAPERWQQSSRCSVGDEPQRADDPWWSYYTSQTRDLEGVREGAARSSAEGVAVKAALAVAMLLRAAV